jgi:exodeoxyribonuclease VII small subunit
VNLPAPKKPKPPEAAPGAESAHKIDFEKSLSRLEEVVRRLEHANLPLDEAMKLFEEGVELAQKCQKQIEEAEGRVEILLKSADGKLAPAPFQPDGTPKDESS